jgi:hypothetical protein
MANVEKLKVGPYRCIFPSLATPKAFEGQTEAQAKYAVKVLIPKKDKETVKAINAFLEAAVAKTAWPAGAKKQVIQVAKNQDMMNDNCVLKDGDAINERRVGEEKAPVDAYNGHYVLTLSRKGTFGAPGIYLAGKGADGKAAVCPPERTNAEIQSGFWVNAFFQSYCYSKPKQGITLSLIAVQKVKEDTVFGQINPFDAIDVEVEESTGSNPFTDDEVPI